MLKEADLAACRNCQECQLQLLGRQVRERLRLWELEASMKTAPWPEFVRSQELTERFRICQRWVLCSAGVGGMAMRWSPVPEGDGQIWRDPDIPESEYADGYSYGYGNGAGYGWPDAVIWDPFDMESWYAIARGWHAEDSTLTNWWCGPLGQRMEDICNEIAPLVAPRDSPPPWVHEEFINMLYITAANGGGRMPPDLGPPWADSPWAPSPHPPLAPPCTPEEPWE